MGQTGSKHHETCDRMKEVLQSKSSGTFSTTETQSHSSHSNKYTTSGKAMTTVAPLASTVATEPISSLHPHTASTLSNIPWLIQARNAQSILTNPNTPILANQNAPVLSNQNTTVLANQSAQVLPVTQGQLLTSAEFPLGAIPLESLAAILEIYNRQNQINNPAQSTVNNLTHYNLQPVDIRPRSQSTENQQQQQQQQQVFTSIFNEPENIKAEVLSHLPETIHYSQLAESSSSSSSPRYTPQQGTPNLSSQREEDIKNEPGTSTDLQQDDSRLPKKKRRLPASVLALAESERPETSKSRRVVDEIEGDGGRLMPEESSNGYGAGASRNYHFVSPTTVASEPVQRIHDFELFMEAVGQLKKLEDEYKQKHEDLLECESRLRKQYELMDAQSSNLRRLIQNLTGSSSVIEHSSLSSSRDHSANIDGKLSGSFGTSSSTVIGGISRSVNQSNDADDEDDGNDDEVNAAFDRKNSKDKR